MMFREMPLTLPVSRIRKENDTLRTFYFDQPLPANPGQFIMVNIHGVGEKPFSLLTAGIKGFAFTAKRLGPFTQALFNLDVGEKLAIRGAFGQGFTVTGKKILMVGGGYATPPLHYLAQQIRRDSIEQLVIVNGARSAADLLYVEEFETVADVYHSATDDGSTGFHGTAVDCMQELMKDQDFDQVYVSGPELMSAAAVQVLNKMDLPYEVCLERYMKCGVGVCGSCVMDPTGLVLCMEGPVLKKEHLQPVTDFGHFHRDKTGCVHSF